MTHILYWNAFALKANRRDFSNVPGTAKPSPEQGGPTLSSRALAIVHLAMYDAHAEAVNTPATLPPYLSGLPAAGVGASPAEAAAYAAHATLTALFPRGLWQMIEENGFSRVYLGLHWFFDAFALKSNNKPEPMQDIGGVPLRLKIAEDTFSSFMNIGSSSSPWKSTVPPRM